MCSKHPHEACYGTCKCLPQPGETWFYVGDNVKILRQAHGDGKLWIHYQRGQRFGYATWSWMQRHGAVRVVDLPRGTVTGRISGAEPNTQELSAPLNIGSRWVRNDGKGTVVVIHATDVGGLRHEGRVHYRQPDKPSIRGVCPVRLWRHNYTPLNSNVFDVYTLRAASYFDVHPSTVGSLLRETGKQLVLAEIYGAAVKPRNLHDGERANALNEAIVRYINEDLPVPIEWVEEFNELRTRLNKQEKIDG